MKEKNNRPEKKTPSISSGDNGSSTSGREGKGVRAEGAERPRENAGIQWLLITAGRNAVIMEEEGWDAVGKTVGLWDLRTHRKNHGGW